MEKTNKTLTLAPIGLKVKRKLLNLSNEASKTGSCHLSSLIPQHSSLILCVVAMLTSLHT